MRSLCSDFEMDRELCRPWGWMRPAQATVAGDVLQRSGPENFEIGRFISTCRASVWPSPTHSGLPPGCRAGEVAALGRRVHFWPFDGWSIRIKECRPSWRCTPRSVSRSLARESRTRHDQHDGSPTVCNTAPRCRPARRFGHLLGTVPHARRAQGGRASRVGSWASREDGEGAVMIVALERPLMARQYGQSKTDRTALQSSSTNFFEKHRSGWTPKL